MSALSIQVPFPVFQGRDGQPLDNGYVWIGEPNLNPQTNPVVAYFDAALTIPAVQPLRTLNGYVSRAGTPAQIYVDGVNFSILVQDSKGSMVYNFPDGSGISPNAAGVEYDPPFPGSVPTTVEAKLGELAVSLYDFGGTFEGDCISAMDLAIASGATQIVVPDNVTLGQHTIESDNLTIFGGRNVTFSNLVTAPGFKIGSSGRIVITGFLDAVLPVYPDTGGVIADGAVFVGLDSGAVIDELYITNNSFSGGRVGISAAFENGRTLNKRCEIVNNIADNQNGGLGGEGYGIHYANENDTGDAYIANNTVYESGRHGVYIARNKGGGSVTLVGNTVVNHRENSSTKGTEVRSAIGIFRASNVTGYGNTVTGFYDSALMVAEEGEAVVSPISADNVKLYGTIIRNPKNTTAAVYVGFITPSATATINNLLLDGLSFESTLNGSQVLQYSWGRGIKIKNLAITYKDTTVGSRMLILVGNATAGTTDGISIESANVSLLNCTGTYSIFRPIAPFATNNMPLSVRDVRLVSNTGGATVLDWEPSVTVTNTEIDVFGFSWPVAATSNPKQIDFPSGINSLEASTTWDPASIAAGSTAAVNVTVTGALLGDFAVPSFSISISTLSMTAAVVATDTVQVRLSNNTASPVDLASATLRVLVLKRL